MKVLVLYDSVFGNTEQIAQAICAAFSSQAEVSCLRTGEREPDTLADLDLIVVGSPTRAFSPTPAVKKWLAKIPANSLSGMCVAAFDTRVDVNKIDSRVLSGFAHVFGYAAQPIADRLTKKGGALILPAEGFYVQDTEGPLKPGELERAAEWAKQILDEAMP